MNEKDWEQLVSLVKSVFYSEHGVSLLRLLRDNFIYRNIGEGYQTNEQVRFMLGQKDVVMMLVKIMEEELHVGIEAGMAKRKVSKRRRSSKSV